MADLLTADNLVALGALALLEIVLGIDNIVFLAIVAGKLRGRQQVTARRLGLLLALAIRILLLLAIASIMALTAPLFTVLGRAISGRDLILLAGGLFLLAKATWEIYDKLEVEHAAPSAGRGAAAFALVLLQILVLDVIFSLDSVITAVGMASDLWIMIAAMVIAVLVMLLSAGAVVGFVDRHPSVKILALSFLLLIGVMLIAEGMGSHMEKGYVYFAMGFSLFVELLNMRYRRRVSPVVLHGPLEHDRG